jgi:hypothetical protein
VEYLGLTGMEIVKMGAMMGSSESHEVRMVSLTYSNYFIAVGVIIGFIFGNFLVFSTMNGN